MRTSLQSVLFMLCLWHELEQSRTALFLPFVAFLMNGHWRVAAMGGVMEYQADRWQ